MATCGGDYAACSDSMECFGDLVCSPNNRCGGLGAVPCADDNYCAGSISCSPSTDECGGEDAACTGDEQCMNGFICVVGECAVAGQPGMLRRDALRTCQQLNAIASFKALYVLKAPIAKMVFTVGVTICAEASAR